MTATPGQHGVHEVTFVIQVGERTVFFGGDSLRVPELDTIPDRFGPVDLAILPIGDYYTMGPDDAVRAVKLIKPRFVVPIHYNTFPPIETDAHAFKSDVESATQSSVVILEPGETHAA